MAELTRKRHDGIEVYLGLQLEKGSTTVQFTGPLLADGGRPIQSLAPDEYMVLAILNANYVLKEIVHLTSYETGEVTGTITRGQEGTLDVTHSKGVKVVHSPTANDFDAFDQHIGDTHAHESVIRAIADAEAKEEVAIHEADPDPHPQYLTESELVIAEGDTFNVHGILHIHEGATLLVEGDIVIQGTGRIFINGKQLIISNTAPTAPLANVVWIQTFG